MMRTMLFVTALLLAGGVAAQSTPQPPAPAEPPAPPAAPGAGPGTSDLEKQLEDARRRLEEAAHQVAELSTQISGPMIEELMPYGGSAHALIGVQLDGSAGRAGAHVREVSPGGPAADAGIRPGDVIVAVNGTAVSGAEPVRQVTHIMREVKPESRVKVRVLRDGKPQEFVVVARSRPAMLVGMPNIELPPLPDLRGAFVFRRPLMDMELATLTPRLGSYFGTDHGVLVVRAPADGALQLEDGDVILSIDGREPSSGSHATRILGSYQPGEKIRLRVLRQRKTLEIETTLPEDSGREHARTRAMQPRRDVPSERPVIYATDAV
jgi:S1-C subfamily serine protease